MTADPTAPKIDTTAPERIWLDAGTFNGAVGFAHSKQHHQGDWKPYVAEAFAAAQTAAAVQEMREAVDRVSKLFEWCASTLVPADYAQGYREALEHVRDAARGSKEGSPTTPDEQRIRQDERNAIAAYIGMSPSEVTDRQYHMEAIRTGRYRDDPLMQRGGWMEGGDG